MNEQDQELLELMKKAQEDTNEHRAWYAFEQVIKYLEQRGQVA
jgi:hypothetical protein